MPAHNSRMPHYAGSAVTLLNDKDFVFRSRGADKGTPTLKRPHLPGYIIFYADWCHYCQDQVANYRRLAEKSLASPLHRSAIYAVDCSQDNTPLHPAHNLREALGIDGFPTFYLVSPDSRTLQHLDIRVSDLDEQGLDRLLAPLMAMAKPTKSPAVKAKNSPSPSHPLPPSFPHPLPLGTQRRGKGSGNSAAAGLGVGPVSIPLPTFASASTPVSTPLALQSGGGQETEPALPRLCMALTAHSHFRCTREVSGGELFCWQHQKSRH